MQNAIQKFRQSSIVFEKPGILSENLKTLTSSNYSTVQYFLLKLRKLSIYHCLKMCGIFFILFRSWVICKNEKRPGFYILVFYTSLKTTCGKYLPSSLKIDLTVTVNIRSFSILFEIKLSSDSNLIFMKCFHTHLFTSIYCLNQMFNFITKFCKFY